METPDKLDIVDFDLGPDRELPCGCWVINGAIAYVSKAKIDIRNLYARPGRFIPITCSGNGDH